MSKIEEFRSFMHEINVDAFILHTKDEYLNEYSEELRQLCGFTGTNGLLIVMKNNKCPFFTDGRYITQARSQLDQNTFQIYNMQEKDPCEWVKENLTSTTTLSYYSQYFTIKDIRKYENICKLVPCSVEKRDNHQKQAMVLHSIQYSGESSKDKCERIAKSIHSPAEAVLLTDPHSISWLLNLRNENRLLLKPVYGEKFLGDAQASTAEYLNVFEERRQASTRKLPSEIKFRKESNAKYTPCILARAILYKNGNVDLFIQDKKHSTLEGNLDSHINIFDISELESSLNKLNSIIIDPNTTTMDIANLIENKQIIEKEDPCLLSKAVKNQTEIAGAVNAHIKDGIAVTNFLYWIENNVSDEITELDAEEKLLEYRKEQDLFKQPSFPTISAFNENAAIIHYRASSETNKVIQENGLYLVDSGGQYLDGTTDVTRTVAIGTPTNKQIIHYTIVLKAHIAIASAVFPSGTTGGELDILARAHLWKFGMDYMHGTGHGVGSYLSVHEGPQAISKGNKVKLVPGMILSNEPGYYIPGKYGIRIENLMYVDKHENRLLSKLAFERQVLGAHGAENRSVLNIHEDLSTGTTTQLPTEVEFRKKSNGFLKFKQLTCIPYDRRLIDVQMLTKDEIEWINNYHKFAYKNLKKSIKDKEWLRNLCGELKNDMEYEV